MAFTVNLQSNASEHNRLDKKVTTVLSLSGTLKEKTSIIDPIILIECTISQLTDVNYMSIPIFNRSYFINDIKSIHNNLFEFSCHVDVLSSFSTQIKNNTAIIYRQENDWNLYLDDGSFKIYQNPNILTKAFPSGFSNQEFVLAVAGS